MKRFLFIDDIRFPYIEKRTTIKDCSAYHYTNFELFKVENWDIVRTYDEFVNYINTYGVNELFISFDHDLADFTYGVEKTGYDCAKYLCDYCQSNNVKFPDYFIHSMNGTGKMNIISYISNYKKHIEL